MEKKFNNSGKDKAEEKKDFEFVTETIKKKPLNKRRILQKAASSIIFGVIAGAVACMVFAYSAPGLYEKLNPPKVMDDTVPVTIPRDDNLVEEEPSYNAVNTAGSNPSASGASNSGTVEASQDEAGENEGTDLNSSQPDDGKAAASADDKKDDSLDEEKSGDDENKSDEDPDKEKEIKLDDGSDEENDENGQDDEKLSEDGTVVKEVVKELEVEDYKNLFGKFREINHNTSRSLATVTLVSDNTDWFMNNYETGNTFTGIILADNGRELLIIANIEKLNMANDIEVTFCDGKVYEGTVKKFDPNTGLTVVAVNLSIIEDETRTAITMAKLGNSSNPTLVGTPVMALGAPLGIDGSMQLGLVTSSSHVLEYADTNLRYITTDMYGSSDGSGIIIDLDGRIVGIIFHGGTSADTRNLICAYGISDIKAKIEKISNGQDLAYLGIIGTDVTEEAVETLGVPAGTYVKKVFVDSPAMRGGIRNGDVIVKFGTTDILKFSDFKEAMLKSQPGDTAVITVKRPGKMAYVEFSYEITLEELQ